MAKALFRTKKQQGAVWFMPDLPVYAPAQRSSFNAQVCRETANRPSLYLSRLSSPRSRVKGIYIGFIQKHLLPMLTYKQPELSRCPLPSHQPNPLIHRHFFYIFIFSHDCSLQISPRELNGLPVTFYPLTQLSISIRIYLVQV